MSSKISERVRAEVGLATADIDTPATGPWYPAANARRIRALLVTGAPSTGKKAKLELLQAQDGSGTGAKELVPAVESAAAESGQTEIFLQAEAQSSDFDEANGFAFVAVKASTDNGAELNASAVLEFADERYLDPGEQLEVDAIEDDSNGEA